MSPITDEQDFNVKLKRRGNKKLRKSLLGPLGYGLPVRLSGYTLVGEVSGRLARLYQRNDHTKAGSSIWDSLKYAEVPRHFFSDRFWTDFCLKLDRILLQDEVWSWVNIWHPRKGLLIQVYRSESGKYLHIPKKIVDDRFTLLMRSDATRMRVTSTKAETKAREGLLKHLNGRQKRELLATGAFVEVGRSGVHYRITFGRPTVAYRSEPVGGRLKAIHFLAGLCLHPLGYYEDTLTGCLPPSDDMLAHLLMIRSSEHYFWRKAGQHSLDDPRVGF